MKSPSQIAMTLAALLILVPKIQSATHAVPQATQREASGTKPDANVAATQNSGTISVPLPKGKKLILTDGTFQLVREYSVQDDRVRYWSLERSDWEEIPVALVDWDATHKNEAEQARQDANLKAKIHASEIVERTKDIDVDRSLEIKPGLFLPDGVGFYALDSKLIYEMKQDVAVSKMSVGRETERILSGIPIIPSKATLEISDAHAPLRLDTAEPEFFMRPADDREPHFRLLRAQIKNGHRVLENVSIHFTGEQTHQATEIDIQTWTPAHGVFRYTVTKRLDPGEYAFVEMTNEGTSGYVWDFGINAPSTKPGK